MAAHLVFHEFRRGTKPIGRGYRTPDPSPTPSCSELPGCAGAGEWVEEFVPELNVNWTARASSDGSSPTNREEVPIAPPSTAIGANQTECVEIFLATAVSEEPHGEVPSDLQPPPRTVSYGSVGHPLSCGGPCKYAWKRRGCKDGTKCNRCHLCEWRRGSRKNSDESDFRKNSDESDKVPATAML
eukprot:CAMPEP_0172678130 /NCGR_PEP_ID=MMETSP1074-20121228/15165_1 /TAXON_ID=2916 /ORGANISM="Ceratium fusus, Strain PA161109" /LENGTH=184 /DNA_ID=CAMNT_0013496087 /DNA_START=91 /DNA_END=645 /DNA_ORIENTATION=-